MNINELLKQDTDVQKASDSVGGGGYVKDTDVYLMKINHAFFEESKGGAMGVNISFKHSDEKKTQFNSTIYVTSGTAKGKKNHYVSKLGKKVPLPGYTQLDDMIRLATNDAVNIETLTTETKTVEVYDFAAGGKVNKEVQVISQLNDVVLKVALMKCRANKWEGGAPTSKVIEKNEIERIFGQDNKTIREVVAGTPAGTMQIWLDSYKGTVRDNVTVVGAQASAVSAETKTADNTDDLFGDN